MNEIISKRCTKCGWFRSFHSETGERCPTSYAKSILARNRDGKYEQRGMYVTDWAHSYWSPPADYVEPAPLRDLVDEELAYLLAAA